MCVFCFAMCIFAAIIISSVCTSSFTCLSHDHIMAWLLFFLLHRSSFHFLPGPGSFRWPIPTAPAESSGSSNTGSSGEGVAGRFSHRWELLVNLADLKPGPKVSFATAGKDICIANPQTVWKPHYKQCEAATSISSSFFVLLYRRVSVWCAKALIKALNTFEEYVFVQGHFYLNISAMQVLQWGRNWNAKLWRFSRVWTICFGC